MKLRLAILLSLLLGTAHAETFRCGKWIVSEDLSLAELVARCGEPASRHSRVENVMVRNANTGLMRKAGETTIETWTYLRGSTAPDMLVTIVDGRIKTLERGKQR
jgi:hypothetical protein